MAAGMEENQNLGFTVYKWSSYSGDYLPRLFNVLKYLIILIKLRSAHCEH